MATASPSLQSILSSDGTDKEILELGRSWIPLHSRRMDSLDRLAEAEQREIDLRPSPPSSLIKTQADADMRLCIPQHVGERHDPRVFDTWRGAVMKRSVAYDVTDELRAKYKLPTSATSVHLLEPWPEKQARADQIIGDWDAYLAARQRAHIESGVERAEEENDEIMAALGPLEQAIISTRARTMDGFLVKIRLAAAYACVKPDQITPDFDKELMRGIDTSDFPDLCGLSLLRDLYLLCGEDVKVHGAAQATEIGAAA